VVIGPHLITASDRIMLGSWPKQPGRTDLKEEALLGLARDFDDIAEAIEAGATEPRHPELLC